MTLVFGNIRFVRILAGVPYEKGRQTTAEYPKTSIFSAFGALDLDCETVKRIGTKI